MSLRGLKSRCLDFNQQSWFFLETLGEALGENLFPASSRS